MLAFGFVFSEKISAQSIGVQLKNVQKEMPKCCQPRLNTDAVKRFSTTDSLTSSTKNNTKKSPFYSLKNPIAQAFSAEKLPFFCKIEHKMNKNKPTQVFFRLGNLDLVNEMEGK